VLDVPGIGGAADPDVPDGTVRQAIMRELNPVLQEAGYSAMVP
jgi:hypothetical protein